MYFPKCPVRVLLGIPCPGCGSQRAAHALLHGDFQAALQFNALLVFMIPVIAVMLIAAALRHKYPRFYQLVNNKYVAYSMLVIILAWWVIRIVFHLYI